MAFGAPRGDIVSIILKRSIALAVLGIVPGMALAYLSGRGMQALLAGVKRRVTKSPLPVPRRSRSR
jgi:ABC-type antimicrobial peptide transport system permease subunit